MNRFLSCLLLISIAHLPESYALSVKSNALKNPNLFLIEFPSSTRAFLARANSIAHISLHDYITPPYKVVELTIDVSGQSLLRIYHSHMLSTAELTEALNSTKAIPTSAAKFGQPIGQAIQRVEQKLNPLLDIPTTTTVVKEYPTATHAKNIEYRISRQQELIDLYQSLLQRWGGERIDSSDSLSIDKKTGEITPGKSNQSSKRFKLGGSIFTIEN